MKGQSAAHMRSFEISPLPPFRLDLTVWALRRVPSNVLDRWDGTTYRRSVSVENNTLDLAVRQSGGTDGPVLQVEVMSRHDDHGLTSASEAVERLLGTKSDLSGFYSFADSRAELKPLADRFRGLKPPRFVSYFESLVNGIVFQQISLAAGMSILNRFVETYGVAGSSGRAYAFPTPGLVAGASADDLRRVGFSRQKSRALVELAGEMEAGLTLEQVKMMNNDDAVAFLQRLRGVGRWTAQYFLLRGLGRLDAFPSGDVGARNRIMRLLGLKEPPDNQRMAEIVRRWHPFGGMVYLHFLINSLAEKGLVH